MNNPEESAVTDLRKFTNLVLNGLVDEEATAAALIRYQFQQRTIKDVVRRGSEDPELKAQICDLLNHLVIYLNEEIVETSSKACPDGMDDRHFVQLEKRMHLMFEVYLAMNVVPDYLIPDLTKHVDASREAVKYSYSLCKDYYRWKELPLTLKEFFLDEKEEVKAVVDEPEPTMFARDDGVVSSLAHEKAQSDEDGKKKQFVAKTEKVLNNYRAKNPDYRTMRELINAKTKFRLEGIYCDSLIDDFISVWDMAIDIEPVKTEDKFAFTSLLKKVFLMMVDKRRNDFASKILDKYNNDASGVLPCLDNFVENFQTGLTAAINNLPLDANVLSNNMELFEKAKDPIIWYLLISPAYTVQQILLICVDNKGYVPLVSRIFRAIPTLFERSVNLTPMHFEGFKTQKLLITILHRIFIIGRTTWTSASQWENAAMMTMSFAKERKRKEGQPEKVEDKALLDSFSLVNFALNELFKDYRKPLKAVEIFVKMLQRLLANNNNARMLTNYQFSSSFFDDGNNYLPTSIIMLLMFDLLVEYDGQSNEVCDGARDILKSVSGRLNNDNIIFDTDTCRHLIDEKLNYAPWWIKYSICSWFSSSLQNPKKQVPSGVYKTIAEQHLDEFEQIKPEEVSTVSDCYFRSLFELGLFDVDLAIELLQYGHVAKFESSVVEKIALALVDSYGKKMSKRSGGLDIGKLIISMLQKFDPIRELAPLKSYSSSYLESVKKIEHILVLFMAARIAKEKQLSAARVRTDDTIQTAYDEVISLNQVSDQLMDIFCETTKAHVDKEVMEVEQMRREVEVLLFSTPGTTPNQFKAMVEKENREQSLALQLSMIYLNCSYFCRLYQQVPIKLQQLMNSTLEKQFDSQKFLAKKVMDDVLTEKRKTEVVYAFVDTPVEPTPNEDNIQPVKPAELFRPPVVENVSVESTTYNSNGGGYRQGRYQTGYQGKNRRSNFEQPTSSRGSGRSDRTYAYKGNRFQPVNDSHVFAPRERENVYQNSSHDRDIPRNDYSEYDQEKLYLDDKQPRFHSENRNSNDVRRYSESKDSKYDNKNWNNRSSRWPSESEYSQEDSENRHLDQTIQSVRKFSYRENQQKHNRPGTSSASPPKNQEWKQHQQQKKSFGGGFGENGNKFNGNSRKQPERKPRYTSSNFYEQDEDSLQLLKPDRNELAQAMGLNDPPNPPKPRRSEWTRR